MIDRSAAAALDALRATRRARLLGFLVGAILGVLVASVHWIGLVIGGVLVGLGAADLPRALLRGLGFGLLVLLAWAVALGIAGTLEAVLATGELAALAIAIALGGGLLGSLVRGIV